MKPVLLVTGGSRGIGAAICRAAAREGYDLALSYQSRRSEADRVAAACRAAGAEVLMLATDLTDPAAPAGLVAATVAHYGRLTHVVANAGITGRISRLDAAAPQTIRDTIDINVTATILLCQAAIPYLSTRHGGKGGAIVTISSIAAGIGSPGEFVWYAASKGAVDSFTLGLARELAGEGVRVNAVAPGLIETELHAAGGEPGRAARIAPLVPMGRAGQPEEIAEAVLYLLSDKASYVTGTVLKVGGGR